MACLLIADSVKVGIHGCFSPPSLRETIKCRIWRWGGGMEDKEDNAKVKTAKKQNKKKAAKVFVMISMCDLPGLAPRKPIQWTRALHLLILHAGYRFSPGPLSSIFAYHALPLTLPLYYFFFWVVKITLLSPFFVACTEKERQKIQR